MREYRVLYQDRVVNAETGLLEYVDKQADVTAESMIAAINSVLGIQAPNISGLYKTLISSDSIVVDVI